MAFIVLLLLIPCFCVAASGASLSNSDAPLPICSSIQTISSQPCAARPVPLRLGTPHYTDEARRRQLEGIVILSLIIGKTGYPHDPHVVLPLDKGLDEQAIDAVQESRFRPRKYKGHAVPVKATQKVYFQNCKSYGGRITRSAFEFQHPTQGIASLSGRFHECENFITESRNNPCVPFLAQAYGK